jgi:hypothetical protein
MKSYISRKLPLATRKTVLVVSQREGAINIFLWSFAIAEMSGYRGPLKQPAAPLGACTKFIMGAPSLQEAVSK